MKEIPLTRGKVALVDDEDYEALSRFKWFAHPGKVTWYAGRCVRGRKVWMHRTVANAPENLQVDHRDGDGLNNQKNNLRLATNTQNNHNSRPQRNNKCGYKGVSTTANGRWQGRIQKTHLGTFMDAESAARAFDAEAKKRYGEFAYLNFPEGDRP